MTQDQYRMGAAMLAKINKLEREVKMYEEGFEREDMIFIVANIDLSADYLRPLLADFLKKAQNAVKAELKQTWVTFGEI